MSSDKVVEAFTGEGGRIGMTLSFFAGFVMRLLFVNDRARDGTALLGRFGEA